MRKSPSKPSERGTLEAPTIRARKAPKQARSGELVDAILEAAIRVLTRSGRAFTTTSVATEAGVSVGSLYQYFPNKEALLFRLQADEWTETWSVVTELLFDEARDSTTRRPHRERLERATLAFFRSERDEATLRRALARVDVALHDSPEARALEARARSTMRAFVDEARPDARESERAFAADLLFTTLSALASTLTDRDARGDVLDRPTLDRYARAAAAMLASHLESLR